MRAPLYQQIVEEFRRRIEIGELEPGDRVPSIADLCGHYGVSAITAQRAVTELCRHGLVETVPRKAAYVAGIREAPASRRAPDRPVTRLAIITSMLRSRVALPKGVQPFLDGIVAGILNVAHERNLAVRHEHIPADPMAGGRPRFKPHPDEGVIIFGGCLSPFALSLLAAPGARAALVDAVAPGATCVATDNWGGMGQIMDHLHALGHRKVCIAVGFNLPANTTNENERRDAAAYHAARLGMEAAVTQSGDWDDLLSSASAPDGPTAVVFTRDDAAGRFMRAARERGIRVPDDISVTGFDDWSTDTETLRELTTARIACERMGRAAALQVLEPLPESRRFAVWTRVMPSLVERRSTAPPPRGAAKKGTGL